MAAKHYTIRNLKKGRAWKDSYGEWQDYALSLAGVGEPVRLSLPQPILADPQAGDRIYGRLFEEKANGRIYYKLKPESLPEADRRALDIHAQGGLKLAVKIWLNTTYPTEEARRAAYDNIRTEAVHFARLISEIREEIL